ncbi:RIKEN cDNA 2310042L06, isoform CRA_e [Mus musculus]|uniref:Coiled-coil domain containing 134 n=1 Tax=Mus musculus TaxID=10090 RepID=A0A2R8VI68_MOUSE|nr:RIKEN cDNA 2310042L06, isoform CRA_e [Mus musculus]
MDLLQFLAAFSVLLWPGTEVTGALKSTLDPSLKIYKKMFEVKRREQLLALKNLAQLNDIHQQYKILDVMLKGLFKLSRTWWRTQPFLVTSCCASQRLSTTTLTIIPTGTS